MSTLTLSPAARAYLGALVDVDAAEHAADYGLTARDVDTIARTLSDTTPTTHTTREA